MSYALSGEDDWILAQFPPDYRGFAVDVGAADGELQSNTLLLEEKGWRVLCIEPDPLFAAALQKRRKEYVLCACASVAVESASFRVYLPSPPSFSSLRPRYQHEGLKNASAKDWRTFDVPVRTLDYLLERAEFPRLDVLSVDVEGSEADVLAGCDLSFWKPKVIVSESWDDPPHWSAAAHGYRFIERRADNNLYLRQT